MTRFRKRFEGLSGDIIGGIGVEGETRTDAFALEDLDWMSEGVQEEKISDRQRNPIKSKGKGKKK